MFMRQTKKQKKIKYSRIFFKHNVATIAHHKLTMWSNKQQSKIKIYFKIIQNNLLIKI